MADEALVQVVVDGVDGSGRFDVLVADGACRLVGEVQRTPDLVMGMTSDTFVRFANGELNPMYAYTNGEMRLSGDPGLAFVVQRWFGRK